MIVYNVTIKIDTDIYEEWLSWMKEVHVPDVMRTNLFLENKICRLLGVDEEDGITYAIQYTCESMNVFDTYQQQFAKQLQQEHTERYQGKFVAFRTLMEVV